MVEQILLLRMSQILILSGSSLFLLDIHR